MSELDLCGETTPIYTTNWFLDANWDAYISADPKDRKCLEIGAFEGRSTNYMAKNYCGKVDVIDTFQGSFEHNDANKNRLLDKFIYNTQCYIQQGVIKINMGESSSILPKFLTEVQNQTREKYDYVYIDGSHFAKDVLFDAVLSWDMLKEGGVMMFDDYNWNAFTNPYMQPKIAIEGFLHAYKGLYNVVYVGYQVHIQKIADHPLSNKFSQDRA